MLRAAEARGWELAGHHCWRGTGGPGCPPRILHLDAEEQEGICAPGHPEWVREGVMKGGCSALGLAMVCFCPGDE